MTTTRAHTSFFILVHTAAILRQGIQGGRKLAGSARNLDGLGEVHGHADVAAEQLGIGSVHNLHLLALGGGVVLDNALVDLARLQIREQPKRAGRHIMAVWRDCAVGQGRLGARVVCSAGTGVGHVVEAGAMAGKVASSALDKLVEAPDKVLALVAPGRPHLILLRKVVLVLGCFAFASPNQVAEAAQERAWVQAAFALLLALAFALSLLLALALSLPLPQQLLFPLLLSRPLLLLLAALFLLQQLLLALALAAVLFLLSLGRLRRGRLGRFCFCRRLGRRRSRSSLLLLWRQRQLGRGVPALSRGEVRRVAGSGHRRHCSRFGRHSESKPSLLLMLMLMLPLLLRSTEKQLVFCLFWVVLLSCCVCHSIDAAGS
eukprot:m.130134 g.130134  ORF g.130134 m.130134 type:complete len:375 (-) comp16428_c2_seq3:515-1639(-)